MQKRAELAFRQGADHVIALAPGAPGTVPDTTSVRDSPLLLLHREGRFAVYRIRPEMLSQLQRQSQDQRQR